MNKTRFQATRPSSQGSTLGIVAAVCLVICMVGVFFIWWVTVLGGGRELQSASDSGSVNAAKYALSKIHVDAGTYSDCQLESDTGISLVTYNRCVAKAILISYNAKRLDTPEAYADARRALDDLETITNKLSTLLKEPSQLRGSYESMASSNSLKMLSGRGGVGLKDFRFGHLRSGEPTNVYFHPGNMPPEVSGALYKGSFKSPGGHSYLAGYTPIVLSGKTLLGVPLVSGRGSHLVSDSEFHSRAGLENSVPNAFSFQGLSEEGVTKNLLYRWSSSIASIPISAGNQDSSPSAYPAEIPGGYIEISNLPFLSTTGLEDPDKTAVESIYNRQIYNKIYVSDNGCFSSNEAEMKAWLAYNVGDPPGGPRGMDPQLTGFPLSTSLRKGKYPKQTATISDALAIKSYEGCDMDTYDIRKFDSISRYANSPCFVYLNDMVGNFQNSVNGSKETVPRDQPIMNCEHLRISLRQKFDGKGFGHEGTKYSNPSGLKKYDPRMTSTTLVLIDADANVWDLVQQGSTCPQKVIDGLVRSCKLISAKTTDKEVEDFLKKTIMAPKLNDVSKYFISKNASGKLELSTTKPKYYSDMVPDGPQPESCMYNFREVNGTIVNTEGELHVQEKLYTKIYAGPGLTTGTVLSRDGAEWQESSGYRNLLGKLTFSNDVYYAASLSGQKLQTGTFTCPN